MSNYITLDEMEASGYELGDRIRVTRVRDGQLGDGGSHENGGRRAWVASVGYVENGDKVELIKPTQPDFAVGQLYQPVAGPFAGTVYRYNGNESFEALFTSEFESSYGTVRMLGSLGRLKHVKVQVVAA